jgi:hypothetical protein
MLAESKPDFLAFLLAVLLIYLFFLFIHDLCYTNYKIKLILIIHLIKEKVKF